MTKKYNLINFALFRFIGSSSTEACDFGPPVQGGPKIGTLFCPYTILWNIMVLKATTENKTTYVTKHFKSALFSSKADTLNVW